MRDRNWLGFRVGIDIYLFLCWGQNWLRFCVRAETNWFLCTDRSWLGSVCRPKITCFYYDCRLTWFLCGWSKLTCFLVLCLGIRVDFIFVWGTNWFDFSGGVEINLTSVYGIEFDFILVLGSQLTGLLCGVSKLTVCGPKLTFFKCGDRLNLFLCVWSNWLGFGMQAANVLVLGWASKLTWFLCWWLKLSWFQCGGSILYKRTKMRASNPSQRWLSSSRHKRMKRARGSNLTDVVFPLFLKCISTQQPGPKRNPLKNRSTSILLLLLSH